MLAILWVLLAAAPPALGQEAPAPAEEERGTAAGEDALQEVDLDLRVSVEAPPGSAIVDRGARDGVAVGDPVVLRPRGAGRLRGTVAEVTERSATVELLDAAAVVPPGTPGRVRVRVRVRPKPPADEAPDPVVPEDTPEHPPWQNADEGYGADMPLLAEIQAVRPEDRVRRVTGRAYFSGNAVQWDGGDSNQAFLRLGTDLRIDNPFWQGGGLRFDGEVVYRASNVEEGPGEEIDTTTFRLDRFSYVGGGTRFEDDRRELGRFLQSAVPEFGILDGFEYQHRFGNGHRVSASVGYLPEPDFQLEQGKDWQVAASYRWVEDPTERSGVTAAYQKSWHKGSQDRDLLLLKGWSLPEDGWELSATLWIDLYLGGEQRIDDDLRVTQGLARAARRYDDGSELAFTWSRFGFADIVRQAWPNPGLGEVRDGRFDRLAVTHRRPAGDSSELFGEVGAWSDEDGEGGDAEVGLLTRGWRSEGDAIDLALFALDGSFETVLGVRAGYSWLAGTGDWRLGYEFSNRDQTGFQDDNDDLFQHGLNVERTLRTDWGWDVSARVDAWAWDEELAYALGLYAQRTF